MLKILIIVPLISGLWSVSIISVYVASHFISDRHQPAIGSSGNGKAEIWKRVVRIQAYCIRTVCIQVYSSECELIYMPTWLNNRGIVVVTASTSMHSPLISGPLAAAQTWRLLWLVLYS